MRAVDPALPEPDIPGAGAAVELPPERPRLRRWMTVLWPSFLTAGLLEMLVFAFVDPAGLQGIGVQPVQASPEAVHTIAFLVFWSITSLASALTAFLHAAAPGVDVHDPVRSG